jgi:uncharacterized membrane protein
MKKLLALFPVILLLITQVAIAQGDVFQNISNILVEFSGVIFIIAFVIILLLIAGVFPKTRIGGIPWGTIGLLIAILIVMIVPFFIDLDWLTNAFKPKIEAYKQWQLPEAAANVLTMLGLPPEWMYVPAILYFFILPFAAVFALVYAFLASLNIFTNVSANVNRLLAFIIALMTIPTGILARTTMVMFVFLDIWTLGVFFVTFVVGVFYRGATLVQRERAEFRKYVKLEKKGLERIVADLRDARKGTVETMRKVATDAANAAPALNIGTRAVRELQMAANPQTPPNEVPKYIDGAIRELEKSL